MSVIRCPHCQRGMKAVPAVLGKNVRCPGCGGTFVAQPESETPRAPVAPLTSAPPAPAVDPAAPEPGPPAKPQKGLRVAVVLLAFLGAVASGALGGKKLYDFYSQYDKIQQAEAMMRFARAFGENVSRLDDTRREMYDHVLMGYLLVGAAIVGLIGGILADRGKGLLPGMLLIIAGAAPGLFIPISTVFTSPMLLAGGLSLFLHTAPALRLKGKVVAEIAATGIAFALLAAVAVERLRPGGHSVTALLVPAGSEAFGSGQSAFGDPVGSIGNSRDRERDQPALTAQQVAAGKPDFTLSAKELYDEYQKDVDAAQAKYSGKLVEVTGTVMEFGEGRSASESIFTLHEKSADLFGHGVICAFPEQETWARFGAGQKVKVKGAWAGRRVYDCCLLHCVVLEAGPNPAVLFAAAELASQFEKAADDVTEQYQDRPVVVEGVVRQKKLEKDGEGKIFLQGTDKTPIICDFWAPERAQTKGIKEGATIKVYGTLSTGLNNELELRRCRLITQPTTAQPPAAAGSIDYAKDAVKDPARVAEMIARAGAEVKLAPLTFQLAGAEFTMQAPEGARVKSEPGFIEISAGKEFDERFMLQLYTGQVKLDIARQAWPLSKGERLKAYVIDAPDLVVRRVNTRGKYGGSWRIAHVFVLNKTLGPLDLRAEDSDRRQFTLDECLLMIKCAQTLALKPGYQPPESLEALKKLGLEVEEASGSIGENFTDSTLPYAVKFLSKVEQLRIKAPITDDGLKHLAGLTALRRIDFWSTAGQEFRLTGAGLVHLQGLTNLEELNLSYSALNDQALAALAGFARLKKLNLSSTGVTGSGLNAIKSLAKLEELNLGYAPIGDAGLEHLAGLINLRELDLSHTQVTDAGLKALKNLTRLEKLRLDETNITGVGLQQLSAAAKLKALSLTKTKITDAALVHVGSLRTLEDLHLDETAVTDAGFAHLKGLTQMQFLWVNKTALTDAALEHLQGVTALLLVGAENTKITKEGADRLKKKLPNASVSVSKPKD